VWVKTNDCGNYDSNPYITKGTTAYRIWHSADNRITFTIRGGATDYSATFPVDSSFNGVWHHLAGTYDGNDLKLYVDNVLENTTHHTGTIATNFNWLGIGTTAGVAQYYNGVIDEARIYNRALDPNEVAYLATDGTGVIPLNSLANLYDVAPHIINFKDFAMLADKWLEEELWP
jgi:beta-galactosidase